jgi:oligosaccharide repeat unit polymerase
MQQETKLARHPGPVPALPGTRLHAFVETAGLIVYALVSCILFIQHLVSQTDAGVMTAVLLCVLVGLSWRNLGSGRHPCFLFLSILTLVQGGRLLAYCLGADLNPLRVANLTGAPFDISREATGLSLLAVGSAALLVYLPCRWCYRPIDPPQTGRVKKYLPYLYLLFFLSLPVQAFKNYEYYQVAQANGGYLYYYVNHAAFASSVPFLVRLLALAAFPTFIALFAFETRRRRLWMVACLYFCSSILVLLLGSRFGTFGLLLALWYAAGVKSGRKSRLLWALGLGIVLLVGAEVVELHREDPDSVQSYTFAPLSFIRVQGNSLDVTQLAIAYRQVFSPYGASYLWNELQDAFVPRDASDYVRGRRFADDVTAFLNASVFETGMGTSSSYIAECYVIGGMIGVLVVSLLVGFGLHVLYRASGTSVGLFIVVMMLPDVIAMPRGQLLDWPSVLLRSFLYIGVLWMGWQVYRCIAWLKNAPRLAMVVPVSTQQDDRLSPDANE